MAQTVTHTQPRAHWLRRALWRVATERASAAQIGAAVAVGVIIGTTPLFGLHLLICIVVATLLGLNRMITYLAANISVPWIAPLLAFGSLQLGHRVTKGEWLQLTMAQVADLDPATVGGFWLLGSLLLGTALGVPMGAVAYIAVRTYRSRHPLPPDPIGDAMTDVTRHYAPAGRWTMGYVGGKFKHDPIYRTLAEHTPLESPLLDIGCGRGQTTLLLHALQPELHTLGVDFDAEKIDKARAAASAGPQTTSAAFEVASSHDAPLPRSGTILLLDVLHYSPAETQDDILRRAAAALSPGGRVFIREVDAAAGWRARLTRWQETLGRAIGLNRGATLCFRPIAALRAVLEQEGLTTQVTPCYGATPLANMLLTATRPERREGA